MELPAIDFKGCFTDFNSRDRANHHREKWKKGQGKFFHGKKNWEFCVKNVAWMHCFQIKRKHGQDQVAAIAIVLGFRWLAEGTQGILLITGGVLGGFFGVVTNLAAAEIIRVFLAIEENTRGIQASLCNRDDQR